MRQFVTTSCASTRQNEREPFPGRGAERMYADLQTTSASPACCLFDGEPAKTIVLSLLPLVDFPVIFNVRGVFQSAES